MLYPVFQDIRRAVFPVAGFSRRFLPATKAVPQEMLCVVDKPLIQYAVEEALEAGITDMFFVTCRSKRAIEDHFDQAHGLEHGPTLQSENALLDTLQDLKPKGVEYYFLRQAEPLGLGQALLCAERLLNDEPFAVIMADDLFVGRQPVLQQMTDLFHVHGSSIIGVEQMFLEQPPGCGFVETTHMAGRLHQVDSFLKEPSVLGVRSDLHAVGRFILTPAIFRHLHASQPAADGTCQLLDALDRLLAEERILAYEFFGKRYDCCSKLGYLQATVDLALMHPEVDDEFAEFLIERLSHMLQPDHD
jgi:UTP--glucose-1-phosphate uridylyltransferase